LDTRRASNKFYFVIVNASISTLEHGRNVCADTTNGAGTIAAKVAIVAVSALMTLSELREDLEPVRRKPRPAPYSAVGGLFKATCSALR